MTFVNAPQWSYDIFLSYARLDNRESFGERAWVSTIRDMMRNDIRQRTGCDVLIFFDESSDENLDADSFDNGVKQSAVLMPVITPIYLTRPYCELEWQGFCTSHDSTKSIVGIQPYPLPKNAKRFPDMEKVFPTQFFDSLADRPKRFKFGTTSFEKAYDQFLSRMMKKLKDLNAEYGAELR